MKEFSIGSNEAGQKLHKYLLKVLKNAPASFSYKMLRKKNIVLNDKKATGNEILQSGDKVTFYLADDTFEKFAGKVEPIQSIPKKEQDSTKHKKNTWNPNKVPIVYEDEHILLYNKPVGMLSQKAKDGDYSINEYFIDHMLESGQLTKEQFRTFKPSICNRLDRNTSGLLICGKSMSGLQMMSSLLKDRTLHKYYRCIVIGEVKESFTLNGYLCKDEKTNKVTVKKEPFKGADEIHTSFEPVQVATIELQGKEEVVSLLHVHLITGKTHQIRAHLASIGHPIVGDYKYGKGNVNDGFKKKYGVKSQLLHAFCLKFPNMEVPFEHLSQKNFTAQPPDVFAKILGGESTWQHGTPED